MIGRGSQWSRWDPHIHSPGTVLNDQFGGQSAWERYLSEIESKEPKIKALAITDYYLIDNYKILLSHKASGRLPDVELIIPNVEMRLFVAARSGFVNIHLLVSNEDENHIYELEKILSSFRLRAFDGWFYCTRADLTRLGKRSNPSLEGDQALEEGAKQFKVDFNELRKLFDESAWARDNILVAVAGGIADGTSGVRDAADTVVRQEIEAFADIIFASSRAQREFWLGQRSASPEEIIARYRGLKPCLHGSDSHAHSTIGETEGNRHCWRCRREVC